MDIDTIRSRISSILASPPFLFNAAADPERFDGDPLETLDGCFGLTVEGGPVTGCTHGVEQRVDHLGIHVARLQQGQPEACYRALLADCTSITAALVQDGAEGGGDYDVPDDGRGFSLDHTPGRAYSVLHLTLPVDYEAQL